MMVPQYLPFALPISISQICLWPPARASSLTVHKYLKSSQAMSICDHQYFLTGSWESSVPLLHMYNSTSGWNKPHGPFCFLNSLIVIPNIPMATTRLAFPSQSHWADEGSSYPSEKIHLFCRQTPDERGLDYRRAAQHLPHTYL